jgi:hypothetical protein
MSSNPWTYLENWTKNNVRATGYNDKAEAERLAYECRRDAAKAGMSDRGVVKASGGNLERFMLCELDDSANSEVERLSSKRD